VITPFDSKRQKSLSTDDVPHNFSLLAVYELPFGRGKRFLNSGGFVDKALGGWTLSSTVKLTSGTPFYFRNGGSSCNVPSQFRVACVPGINPGANPFAQSLDNFDPNKPLFNIAAFESASSFNFYSGAGQRVTGYRGFGYKNADLSVTKNIALTERFKFELRAEMFNVFNAHFLTCGGDAFGDCIPFNNDTSNSNFGKWTGTVTNPRNIQLVGRFTF